MPTGPQNYYGTELNRHESSPAGQNTPARLWRIESIDSRDSGGAAVLMSGSVFELLDPQRQEYLLLGSDAGDALVSRAQGSRFMVYKADVPDSSEEIIGILSEFTPSNGAHTST